MLTPVGGMLPVAQKKHYKAVLCTSYFVGSGKHLRNPLQRRAICNWRWFWSRVLTRTKRWRGSFFLLNVRSRSSWTFLALRVSRALSLLEEKGLIARQQGVGTRISQHLDYSLDDLDDEEAGFTKLVLQAGGIAGNRWLERTTTLLPDDVASSVPALKGERVTKLRRVRLINGEPVSLETTWIPLALLPAPEILENSPYQYWAERGILPAKKKVRIKAIACQAETARLLNIQPGMPLLFYRQHTYNAQNGLLEYCEIYCRSDIYEIQISG